jgi:hypothetical protein
MLLTILYLNILWTLFMLVQTTHHYLSKKFHSCLVFSFLNRTLLQESYNINSSLNHQHQQPRAE